MKKMIKATVTLVPMLWLIGCAGPEKKPEPAASPTPVVEAAPAPVVEAPPPPPPAPVAAPVIEEKKAEAPDLTKEIKIYFDFDKSDIKPEFKAVVEAHAKKLMADSSLKVRIEGHCDERGTKEYNIALGERRATAVQNMLKLLGVSARQITTVSMGEEHPERDGHDESAWQWNRRAVFVY